MEDQRRITPVRCAGPLYMLHTRTEGRSVRERGREAPPFPPQRPTLPGLVHCAIAQICTGAQRTEDGAQRTSLQVVANLVLTADA